MEKRSPKYWPAFDCEWFQRNQQWIICAVNMPVVGRWLRRKLGLRPNLPLAMLTPMSGHYALPDGQYIAEVYTTWRFSRLMYRALKPLWWAIHYWDELIADRYLPELSYGFDSLSASVSSGYPVTNFDMPVSSDSEGVDASYSKAWNGATITQYPGEFGPLLIVGQSYTANPKLWRIDRFWLKFNLGAAFAGVSPVVSSATLALTMTERTNASTLAVNGYEATIADLSTDITTSADWKAFSQLIITRQISTFNLSDPVSSTNTSFNQAGIDLINSKISSYLKICFRHGQDASFTPPSEGIPRSATFRSSDYGSGVGPAPQITITYSRQVALPGIDSSITLGSPTATLGDPKTVLPGIDSTITIGAPTVTVTNNPIVLPGIDSTITVGIPTVATIQAAGIDATMTVGTPTVYTGAVSLISVPGIDSSIEIGAPTVSSPPWVVQMLGIDSTIILGAPALDSPYPDGELFAGPYIARIIDQATEYGYSLYEYEDGGADVNVQPIGNRRWQIEYTGLSAAEVAVLAGHYNGMRGKAATFRFYHRRDGLTYRCRYVSMALPSRQRAWANDVQVVLEALG